MTEARRLTGGFDVVPDTPGEWLVTNGLGGFASATISGTITRRYHGFLIAALPAPVGRMIMLNNLEVALERADGSVADVRQSGRFIDFTLDLGLPSWRYEIDGVVIEMSIVLPSGQNLLHASFRVRDHSQRVRLRLSPLIDFRALEAPVGQLSAREYVLTAQGQRYEPTLFERLLLKTNMSKRREHSLFRQGCMVYDLIPTMPERWLRPLMLAFTRLLEQQPLFSRTLGLV
jgi:hypothetical protein